MSGERILPADLKSSGEYYLYLKEKFMYQWCGRALPQGVFCLDVGCGEGYGTKILAETSSEAKVVGLDISPGTIEKAKSKYKDDHCDFKVYDGKNIPAGDASVDAVVSLQVIEHIRNDRAFVAEVWRALKPGGLFILTTPNRQIRLLPGMRPWNAFHVREYYSADLKDLLREIFSVVNIHGVTASEDIRAIEIARVERNARLAACDFLNLRRLLPPGFVSMLGAAVGNLAGAKKKSASLPAMTEAQVLASFSIEDFNDFTSLDILAVCRK